LGRGLTTVPLPRTQLWHGLLTVPHCATEGLLDQASRMGTFGRA